MEQRVPAEATAQPLFEALRAGCSDSDLAYAGVEAVRNIASENVIRELVEKLEYLRVAMEAQAISVKAENATLKAQVRADIADMKTEVRAVTDSVKADIGTLKAQVRADIADMKTEVRADIASLEAQQVSHAAAIASIQRQVKTHAWLLGILAAAVLSLLGLLYRVLEPKPSSPHAPPQAVVASPADAESLPLSLEQARPADDDDDAGLDEETE